MEGTGGSWLVSEGVIWGWGCGRIQEEGEFSLDGNWIDRKEGRYRVFPFWAIKGL